MRVKIEKPTRFKPKQYMDVTNNVVTFDWEYAFNDKHFDLIDMFEDMKVTVFISSKVFRDFQKFIGGRMTSRVVSNGRTILTFWVRKNKFDYQEILDEM